MRPQKKTKIHRLPGSLGYGYLRLLKACEGCLRLVEAAGQGFPKKTKIPRLPGRFGLGLPEAAQGLRRLLEAGRGCWVGVPQKKRRSLGCRGWFGLGLPEAAQSCLRPLTAARSCLSPKKTKSVSRLVCDSSPANACSFKLNSIFCSHQPQQPWIRSSFSASGRL